MKSINAHMHLFIVGLPGHMDGRFLRRFPDWVCQGKSRPSMGQFCFTIWNYFTKDSPLIPSGLYGPVRILTQDWAAILKPMPQ